MLLSRLLRISRLPRSALPWRHSSISGEAPLSLLRLSSSLDLDLVTQPGPRVQRQDFSFMSLLPYAFLIGSVGLGSVQVAYADSNQVPSFNSSF